jgi:hypothetical protein
MKGDAMFTRIRRGGAWRAAVLVLSVSVASAFAAGAAAGSHTAGAARLATTSQSRSVSCSGLEFNALDTATGADYFNAKRIRAGTGGSGFFTCNPDIPNRAVVTKVQFSIWDGSGSSEMKYCGLYRSGLETATASENVQELASVPATGIDRAPGFARLTDTSIQNAIINTNKYVYWFQCNIPQAGQSLGLYGANAIYTITSVNG